MYIHVLNKYTLSFFHVFGLAAGPYLEYMAWQQVHTWNTWPGSRFIPGIYGLAAGSYTECMNWQQVHTCKKMSWIQVHT
jgi:hypothetical protein